MLHNLKLNHIVHERNFVVTVITEEIPYVSPAQRFHIEPIGDGFYFTFAYPGMGGSALLSELVRYGVSAITLGITILP